MKMLVISAALFSFAVVLRAAEEFPELRTLDGKLYKQVKVMKSTPAEIRFLHAEGVASVPLSQLPPEILAKFGGKASKHEESMAEAQRMLDNVRARPAAVAPPPLAEAPAQGNAVNAGEYIAQAIRERRLLKISYDNGAEGPRMVEPHLLGLTTTGQWALQAWFREGASKSGDEGWRVYLLDKITGMQMQSETFAGARVDYDPEYTGVFQSYAARLERTAPAALPQAAPPAAAPPVADATLARQQQTAMRYAQTTGQPYEKCLQAVQVWEWCASHPQGSVVNGVTYDAQATAQQLAMAQQFLNQRPLVQAAPAAAGVVQSSIMGAFTGFEAGKVYKLQNGQIWEQSDFHYEYQYDFAPDVMIYPSKGRMMMKVEGLEKAVEVMQVR